MQVYIYIVQFCNAQFPLLRSELRFSTIEALRIAVGNRGVLGYGKASTTITRLLIVRLLYDSCMNYMLSCFEVKFRYTVLRHINGNIALEQYEHDIYSYNSMYNDTWITTKYFIWISIWKNHSKKRPRKSSSDTEICVDMFSQGNMMHGVTPEQMQYNAPTYMEHGNMSQGNIHSPVAIHGGNVLTLTDIWNKMYGMQASIEDKIATAKAEITRTIDDKLSAMRAEITSEMQGLKLDIDQMKVRVDRVEEYVATPGAHNVPAKVVIKGLPGESEETPEVTNKIVT